MVLALRRCLVVLGLLADLMVRKDLAALYYLAHQGNLVLQPLPVVHVLPADLVVHEDLLLLVVPVALLHLVVRCYLAVRWVLLDPVVQESLWDPEVRQSQLDLWVLCFLEILDFRAHQPLLAVLSALASHVPLWVRVNLVDLLHL